MPTLPGAPVTVHLLNFWPVENTVKPPTGTTGLSKPPSLIRLAGAAVAVAAKSSAPTTPTTTTLVPRRSIMSSPMVKLVRSVASLP